MDVFLIIIILLFLALAYWLFRKKMLWPVLIYLGVMGVIIYTGKMLKEVFEEVFLTILILLLLVLAYWSFRKKMIAPMLICLGVAGGWIAAYMDMKFTATLLSATANGGVLYVLYSAALGRSTQQPFPLLIFLWFISFVGLSYDLPSHLRLLYGAGKPTPITIVFISILILTFLTLAYKCFRKEMISIALICLGVAGAFLATSMGMEATALLLFFGINFGIVAHAFMAIDALEKGHHFHLGNEWKLILLAWLLSLFGMWDIGSCRDPCKFVPWPGEFISILIPTLSVLAYWSSRKKIGTLREVSLFLACAFVIVGIVDSSFSPYWLKWWYRDYPFFAFLTVIFLLLFFGGSGFGSFGVLMDMYSKVGRRQYRFPYNLIWFFVAFLSLFGFIVYLSHFFPGTGSSFGW